MSSWTGVVVPWQGLAGTEWEGAAARALVGTGVPVEGPSPGSGVVLADERCPGLTADVVRRVVASAGDAVAVGVRPVTDTVKTLQDGYVGPTVDRDALVAVCSPVVVPAGLVDRLGELPDAMDDLPALVARLVDAGEPVVLVEVPAEARRLTDVDELVLLTS